jgi:hypothetical protein
MLYKFLLQSNDSNDDIDEFSQKISEELFIKILCDKKKFDTSRISFIGFKLFQKYFNNQY